MAPCCDGRQHTWTTESPSTCRDLEMRCSPCVMTFRTACTSGVLLTSGSYAPTKWLAWGSGGRSLLTRRPPSWQDCGDPNLMHPTAATCTLMAELLEQDVLNAEARYSNPVKHVAKCRIMTTALEWQAGTAASWPLYREGTCQSFLLPVDGWISSNRAPARTFPQELNTRPVPGTTGEGQPQFARRRGNRSSGIGIASCGY
jgi:hypothetical protein